MTLHELVQSYGPIELSYDHTEDDEMAWTISATRWWWEAPEGKRLMVHAHGGSIEECVADLARSPKAEWHCR